MTDKHIVVLLVSHFLKTRQGESQQLQKSALVQRFWEACSSVLQSSETFLALYMSSIYSVATANMAVAKSLSGRNAINDPHP